MRLPHAQPADAVILSTLLFPFLTAATGSFDCTNIRVDRVPFDLRELGGPRSVVSSIAGSESSPNTTTTTYTIDICKPLTNKDKQCPHGARICAVTRVITDEDIVSEVFYSIAGDLREKGGKDMDAKWGRLKDSPYNSDSDKEGLLADLKGGFKTVNGKKKEQKAIIEFLCDKSRTGLEHLPDPEKSYNGENQKREDEDEGEDSTPSLTFQSYKDVEGVDVLRLKWRTLHACEDAKEEQDKEKGEHWGFFTWFIIVAFLSTATYLIFGSWLNYNRYGARGWDLLPHGDTIRDVPYLLKDWIRRVLNTVQGGGSRGGYAAV